MDKKIREPIDYTEQIQYEQLRRLDAIMDMLSGIIKYISEKEGIAIETKVSIEPKKPRKKRVIKSK